MPNLDRDYYLDKGGLAQFVNEFETNIVAEEFSSSATYNLGDYCIYGNLLYICTTPITTAGAWTGSTNWLQVLLADEVSEKTEIQTITLAQWEALTPEQKASGDYVISDATLSPLSASLIPYDNTTSGLTADDVQEAIDEIASGGIVGSLNDLTDVTISSVQNKQELVYNSTSTVFENKTTRIELTQAQYNALVTPQTDVDYYITDAPSMNGTSADLSYDGTTLSTHDKIESLNASDLPITSGSATNTKAYIDNRTTIVSTANDNLYFYRCGNVVYFTVIVGTNNTDANGRIIINNSAYVIPSGYIPRADCNIWESISGKRVTANSDGTFWVNMNSQTGITIRVSACWITYDAMPT